MKIYRRSLQESTWKSNSLHFLDFLKFEIFYKHFIWMLIKQKVHIASHFFSNQNSI